MQKKFLLKIGGEAGFGIMTTGQLIAKNASQFGYHIYEYSEYPSLIRGGHNTCEICISDEEVHSTQKKIDLLICLNKTTFELHKKRLHEKSLVIYEKNDFELPEGNYILIDLPFKQIIKEEMAFLVMINNIALGVSLALLNWNLDILNKTIEESFNKKGEKVIEENKRVAQRGFEYIKTHYSQYIIQDFPQQTSSPKAILTGNDSFALSTIASDCKLYCAYPMTPASTVLDTLAHYQTKTGMIVRHPEDEISVIMTALGGSHAGVRSAVGTSGGGFALMVEGISFAGVTETSLVIYLAQRPGPATGLPTWTEQGDLLFAVRSGHGEFPKIVLAPGNVKEMYELTLKAFDLADIYQTPVIILSDKLLGESHESTDAEIMQKLFDAYMPNRGKLMKNVQTPYNRYEITEDGISHHLIPGQKDIFYQSNSYEHEINGHTTEDAKVRTAQVEKRNRKTKTYLENHFALPEIIGDLDQAEIILVSWGSTKGAIEEAMKELEITHKIAFIHFTHVFPLDKQKIRNLFEHDRTYILIENNSQAQFGKLLLEETGIELKHTLLKYDGRPIFQEDIINYINTI